MRRVYDVWYRYGTPSSRGEVADLFEPHLVVERIAAETRSMGRSRGCAAYLMMRTRTVFP